MTDHCLGNSVSVMLNGLSCSLQRRIPNDLIAEKIANYSTPESKSFPSTHVKVIITTTKS